MHRSLVLLLAPMVALACASAQQGNPVRYRCDGGQTLEVVYGASSARVTLPGQAPADWRQQPSGSGIRYGDGTTTLHSKGRDAFVVRDGRTLVGGCRELE